MKDLIRYIAYALVENPEKVNVNVVHGSQSCVLELKVAKNDLGRVIGRHGRTADAMRTILNAASAKDQKKLVLDIFEYV